MNITLARLVSTLLVPAALIAGAVGCHHQSQSAHAPVVLAPETEQDAPLVPKDHPELAFYSARVQGEAQTKIFVRSSAGEAPRTVYVDIAPGELIQVSDDGMHGVFRRFISPGLSQEDEIDFRLDVDTNVNVVPAKV